MKQNLRNDLTYRQVGEYLLPELEVPEAPKVGVWGKRREAYLREQRNGIYSFVNTAANAAVENEVFCLSREHSRDNVHYTTTV